MDNQPRLNRVPNVKVNFSNRDDEQLIDIVRRHALLWKFSHPDHKSNLKKDVVWNEIGVLLNKRGENCKSRWRSIRDNFRRHKNTEAAGAGKPVRKKRAMYWDRLSFLEGAEHEQQVKSNSTRVTNNNADSATLRRGCSKEEVNGVAEPSSVSEHDEDFSEEDPLLVEDMNGNDETVLYPTDVPVVLYVEEEEEEHDVPAVKKKKTRPTKERPDEEMKKSDMEERVNILDTLQTNRETNEPELMYHPLDLFFQSMSETVKTFPPHLAVEARLKVCQVISEFEFKALQFTCESPSP